MATIEVLAQGFSTSTNEGGISYCSVNLVRGEHITLVDVGYQTRREIIVERLAALGLTVGDIERVVLTHAHWDHSMNLNYFPNAELFIHNDEYEYSQQPHPNDWATPAFIGDILNRAKSIHRVKDGDELEPSVRVMALPGHSPGSMGVMVENSDGVVGLIGDSLPSRAAAMVPTPTARLVFYDEEAAERSARKVLDTCTLIFPGHDRPFRNNGPKFDYLYPQTMTLINPPRDEDGTIRSNIDTAIIPFTPIIQPIAKRKA